MLKLRIDLCKATIREAPSHIRAGIVTRSAPEFTHLLLCRQRRPYPTNHWARQASTSEARVALGCGHEGDVDIVAIKAVHADMAGDMAGDMEDEGSPDDTFAGP